MKLPKFIITMDGVFRLGMVTSAAPAGIIRHFISFSL